MFHLSISSQFFYELTCNDQTHPDTTVVEMWIKAIAQKFGNIVHYSKRLHQLLVNRAIYIKRENRILTGGAPRQRFFQKQWKLQFQHGEILSEAEVTLKRDLYEATSKLEEMKAENILL